MVDPATARPPAGRLGPGDLPGVRPSQADARSDDPPGLLPKPPPELSRDRIDRPDATPTLSGEPPEERPSLAASDEADDRLPVAGRDRADEAFDVRGSATQGALVIAKVPKDTTSVSLGGRALTVSDEGTVLIGFAHDAPERQTLRLVTAEGESHRHVFEVEQRELDATTIVGLPDEEAPSSDPGVREELTAARQRIARARAHDTDQAFYRRGVSWPVKGHITSTYGVVRDVGDQRQSRHWGVDIAVPVGTAVKAPAGGIVRFAEADLPRSGGLVIIDHGHGLSSSLLHLSTIVVGEGDQVRKGQVVAHSGDTGRTTSPHLDWRMNLFDLRIDPMMVVKLDWR